MTSSRKLGEWREERKVQMETREESANGEKREKCKWGEEIFDCRKIRIDENVRH